MALVGKLKSTSLIAGKLYDQVIFNSLFFIFIYFHLESLYLTARPTFFWPLGFDSLALDWFHYQHDLSYLLEAIIFLVSQMHQSYLLVHFH